MKLFMRWCPRDEPIARQEIERAIHTADHVPASPRSKMPGSTRTLHILYINAEAFYYGAEHSLLELIRALDDVRATVLTQCPGRFTEALASYDITFDYFDFQRHHPPPTRSSRIARTQYCNNQEWIWSASTNPTWPIKSSCWH
jgi:hypothetical protein